MAEVAIQGAVAIQATTSGYTSLKRTNDQLLMHMSGAHNAQVFRDETGKAITVGGNARTIEYRLIDCAVGKTYYDGGHYGGDVAANAFDNNEGTHFQGNGAPDWLVVDFGAGNTKIIIELRLMGTLYSGNIQLKDFKLQGSNDSTNGTDGTWADLLTAQHQNVAGWQEYAVTNSTPYRMYRVYVTSSWRGDFSGCGILECRMCEASPVMHPVFGPSMAYFDGNGDYLRLPAITIGTSQFTMHAWITPESMGTSDAWPTDWSSHKAIIVTGTAGSNDGTKFILGKTKLILCNGDTQIISGVHGISAYRRIHVAVTRDSSNVLRMFVAGKKIAETTNAVSFSVGAYTWIATETAEGAYFKGGIDEPEIIVGTALWTADFEPPVSAYGEVPEVIARSWTKASIAGVLSMLTIGLQAPTTATKALVSASAQVVRLANGISNAVCLTEPKARVLYKAAASGNIVNTLQAAGGVVYRNTITIDALTGINIETFFTSGSSAIIHGLFGAAVSAHRTSSIKGTVTNKGTVQGLAGKDISNLSAHLSGLGFAKALTQQILVAEAISLSGATAVSGTTGYTFNQVINEPGRDIHIKLKIYFDGIGQPPVVLEADDILSTRILEELKADGNKPLGFISSNTLDITILNQNGKFTPTNVNSLYYTKMVPKIPIEVFIVMAVEGSPVEIAAGTFYSGDWKSPTSTVETSTNCYDKLYYIAQKPMPVVKTQRNTTIYNMFALIFTLLGLDASEYSIDPTLNVPVGVGYLPQGTVGKALQFLAEAGLCYVYMDRYNVIQVRRLDFTRAPDYVLTDQDQLTDSDIPTNYSDIYTTLTVNRYVPELGASEAVLELTDVTIPTGTTTLMGVQFSKGPVGVVDYAAVLNTLSCTIRVTRSTSWDADLEIINSGSSDVGNIKIFGKPIVFVAIPLTQSNEALEDIAGAKDLKIENHLIQDATHASMYLENMFDLVSNPNGFISADIRGNPQIELGNKVTVKDDTNPIATANALVTRMEMKFEGSMEAFLKGVVVDELQ